MKYLSTIVKVYRKKGVNYDEIVDLWLCCIFKLLTIFSNNTVYKMNSEIDNVNIDNLIHSNEALTANELQPLNYIKQSVTRGTDLDTKKVLALLEENLHLLKNKPFIFLEPVVRKINDNTFQTVYYDPAKDGEIGWTFTTWQIDNEFAVSLVDSTTYNNDTTRHGTEIAKYWFELWNKSDNHYVPYKNITLYENLLEQAKIGKLIGAEFNIGTAIEQIKARRSGAMEEGYYEGAKYLFLS